MASVLSVAIIGAGPYGLSLAAHLAANGVEARVFGPPMASWRNGMPRGMRLKSEGFASRLFDPGNGYSLETFCAERGLPYAALDVPVPVETFTAYGEAFQQRFVENLDPRLITRVERGPHGFTLTLADGASVAARRVVVATGVAPYRHTPDALAGLSRSRLTHTCEHADYASFAGQRVIVIGAGASAVDAAAALQRGGAEAHLVSRRAAVRFHAGGNPRGWRQRLKAPMTPLGPGWKKLFCVKAPLLFHALPARLRNAIVERYLGPAPGWAAREDFEGKVALHLSSTLISARETADGVALEIADGDGRRHTLQADHVVAGTGYRVDVNRLGFLDPAVVAGVALNQSAPRLSSRFESSVPGLYFVGPASAYEFGPMLRFVCGAGFAARRVTAHVIASERARGRLLRHSLDARTPAVETATDFQLDGSPAC